MLGSWMPAGHLPSCSARQIFSSSNDNEFLPSDTCLNRTQRVMDFDPILMPGKFVVMTLASVEHEQHSLASGNGILGALGYCDVWNLEGWRWNGTTEY